jgi:AraC-like DNA-binding protein
MKAVAAKILEDTDAYLFLIKINELPYFSTDFHFHKECEIVYVIEGDGRRIIGDSIEMFGPDEVVFMGSDIPHVWRNNKHDFEYNIGEVHARSITLSFHPEKLVRHLSNFTTVNKLESVLKKARKGMKFSGSAKQKLKRLLYGMTEQKGFSRVITFMKIVELIICTNEYELLASEGYINTYHEKNNERMDKVLKFIFSNFTKEISLDEVAAFANMNKQAFCRYFKSCTQKTFSNFLNEVRVGHACRLMNNGETYIAGLSYHCGFKSLTNFNRFFKQIKGITPREYLKMINL